MPRRTRAGSSEAEGCDPGLVPAEVMSQLVPQSQFDLTGEQLTIVAEVALQSVLEDDDAIGGVVTGDSVAPVQPVRSRFGAVAADNHRHALELTLELLGQPIHRLGDESLELRGLVSRTLLSEPLAALDDRLEALLASARTGDRSDWGRKSHGSSVGRANEPRMRDRDRRLKAAERPGRPGHSHNCWGL